MIITALTTSQQLRLRASISISLVFRPCLLTYVRAEQKPSECCSDPLITTGQEVMISFTLHSNARQQCYTATLHSNTATLHSNAIQQCSNATQQCYTTIQQRYTATQQCYTTQQRGKAMLHNISAIHSNNEQQC